jgi:hypothetical protein
MDVFAMDLNYLDESTQHFSSQHWHWSDLDSSEKVLQQLDGHQMQIPHLVC